MSDNKNTKLNDDMMNVSGGVNNTVAPPKFKVGDRVIFATWDDLNTHGEIIKVAPSDDPTIPGQEWLYTIHRDDGKTDYQFEIDLRPE